MMDSLCSSGKDSIISKVSSKVVVFINSYSPVSVLWGIVDYVE
jgi:hypothetical protein